MCHSKWFCIAFFLYFLANRSRKATKTWTKYLLHEKGTALTIYRSLQILNTQVNNVMCTTVLPVGVFFVVFMQVISCFVCIKFHTALPLPLLSAFSTIASFCFAFELITFAMEAEVYERSGTFLGIMDGNNSKERRLAKRALKRMGVSVGKAYLTDRQTPLELVSFVISTTSNLLVSTWKSSWSKMQ